MPSIKSINIPIVLSNPPSEPTMTRQEQQQMLDDFQELADNVFFALIMSGHTTGDDLPEEIGFAAQVCLDHGCQPEEVANTITVANLNAHHRHHLEMGDQ